MVDNLKFRRQFLVTSRECDIFQSWKEYEINDLFLYLHPDLPLTYVKSPKNSFSFILIGFILDPYNPTFSNKEILKKFADFTEELDDIKDLLLNLSGRFVLIVICQSDKYIFNDPCGLRSVCYKKTSNNFYIASQPFLIDKIVSLDKRESFHKYFSSSYVQNDNEHFLPSGSSLYKGVYRLVPNHFLSISKVKQIRYWPSKILEQQSLDSVVKQTANLLKKSLKAAILRFDLALPLTAGLDSRMLLAASIDYKKEIYYYTLKYRGMDSSSDDIRIPTELADGLNISHNVIDCEKPAPSYFRDIYVENVANAHFSDWGQIAYGMMEEYPERRVCLKGNCAEIARCFFYKYGKHPKVKSHKQIVKFVPGWESLQFIGKEIEDWFVDACSSISKYNINMLDLFYWEHRMGSWQAQSQLEWDIIQEAFTPFNNRRILELLLSTPAKVRSAPNYNLYRMLISELWPDVLEYPINPPTLKEYMKNALYHIGIYEFIKNIYRS